jgi:putative transcriptional regulator
VKNCQGKALVASPYLSDSNFLRSVVYILQHDDQGAFGLVLNRPMSVSVGELLGELTEKEVVNQQPVFYGGPVDGLVVMMQARLGQAGQGDEQKIMVLSKDCEQICEIANQQGTDQSTLRVFDGYSGWGPAQLDQELEEGSWLVWDADPRLLFSDPNGLWQTAVRQIGREVIARSVAGVELSSDPSNN